MILLIDNYDSFTHNLARYIKQVTNLKLMIIKNDDMTLTEVIKLSPTLLVISPGPGTPEKAGISLACIEYFHQKIPILGICLGHQSIAQYFGSTISHATTILHGKTSRVHHDDDLIFNGIPSTFNATRYHSLAIQKESLTHDLVAIAKTDDDEIMAIKHKSLPIYGIQFHPEAYLTEYGHTLINNFFKKTI